MKTSGRFQKKWPIRIYTHIRIGPPVLALTDQSKISTLKMHFNAENVLVNWMWQLGFSFFRKAESLSKQIWWYSEHIPLFIFVFLEQTLTQNWSEIFIDMIDDAVSDLDIWMNGQLGNNCVCNLQLKTFFRLMWSQLMWLRLMITYSWLILSDFEAHLS